MATLSQSGAYVRKKPSKLTIQSHSLQKTSIDHRVWELLETPQTIESLRRALNDDSATDRLQIETAMKRLLDADVIELSPDS